MRVQATDLFGDPPSGPLLTSEGLGHFGSGRCQERVSSDADSLEVAGVVRTARCSRIRSWVHKKNDRSKTSCSRLFDVPYDTSDGPFLGDVFLSGFVVCFGDDSHQRDARHSHHREDRRGTVLFYLNSNSNKIYHSICQQIDKSGIGSTSQPWIKGMRTAVQKVSKVCLAVANPIKDEERNSTSPLSMHGFC